MLATGRVSMVMTMAVSMRSEYEPSRRTWPGRITCSLLAVLGSLMIGTGVLLAYSLKDWTPMERAYIGKYMLTSLISGSPRLNGVVRNFTTRILVVRGGLRLASQDDVDRGELVGWMVSRFDVREFHEWLRVSIYDGESLSELCDPGWYGALVALVILLPIGIKEDFERSKKRRAGSIALRGTNLVSRRQYHQRTRGHDGVGWITEGEAAVWQKLFMHAGERNLVRIGREDEPEHILLLGDSGTGKSSLIRQLLRQVSGRGERAIVYDPALEYLPEFLKPERGDLVLNPLDRRMPYWSPAAELSHESEAEAVAKSLFPDKAGDPNPFFVEAARKIFSYLLKEGAGPGEMYDWIRRADPEIDKRVAGTELEPIITKAAAPQRAGVLSVLERAAAVLRLLPSTGGKRWLATEWTGEQTQSWIFITSTHETREVLRPLVSMWIDLLMLRLLGRSDEQRTAVWVVLDELASLQRLPTLPLALAEARKANTRMVLSLHGRSQVEYEYGRLAEVMLSIPKTKFFLRTSEAQSGRWVSECLGQVEAEKPHEVRRVGDLGLPHSRNLSYDRRIEPAVFAAEIGNLPDLEGYFQTPGLTLRAKFPYSAPRKSQPALVKRADVNAPGAVMVRANDQGKQGPQRLGLGIA